MYSCRFWCILVGISRILQHFQFQFVPEILLLCKFPQRFITAKSLYEKWALRREVAGSKLRVICKSARIIVLKIVLLSANPWRFFNCADAFLTIILLAVRKLFHNESALFWLWFNCRRTPTVHSYGRSLLEKTWKLVIV